jgi:N-acetylneuraminic acid mutarotase
VFGGFTGRTVVDTIYSWKPTGTPVLVAHMPAPIRFTAAAEADRKVIVVGGTVHGAPARDIFRFNPATDTVTRIGTLPIPLGHAAAATLAGTVYVLGGRGQARNSQSRAIYAVNPSTGAVSKAGMLPYGVSDATAVSLDGEILVIGGLDAGGRTHDDLIAVTPIAH